MDKIYIPSSGPGDWRSLLADPAKHWVQGRSARTLAYCWEDANGFPPEVLKVLSQKEDLAGIEPILIFPEWRVSLPGGSRPSQSDIWILAGSRSGLVSIAVEGKVDESFGPTLAEWQTDASHGKEERLRELIRVIGIQEPLPVSLRYQFLHRTASALLEAKRFHAHQAMMLVHSFDSQNTGFCDFSDFASLLGQSAELNRLLTLDSPEGITLNMAWITGDLRFLKS